MLVGSTMENGSGFLADKFSGMVLKDPSSSSSNNNANNNNNNNNNDNLFQVRKAVDAAEATIIKQVEENNLLRSELQKRNQELEKYRTDESIYQRPHSVDPWNERVHGTFEAPHSVPAVSPTISSVVPLDKLLFHPDSLSTKGGPAMQTREENHLESRKVNGTLNVLPSSQTFATQLSSPSTVSFSPSSYRMEGESDPRFNLSERGLMAMTDLNTSSNVWKQDLVVKFREHEEEIMQLRKHLAEYSIKEAQIRNEKYVLEKRIAHMRLAFDQQQQDLVDAASKALSYRQDIIEENIRLTYALQAAQQERSTFVSSLLPLLAEYTLQPPVPDAQSIVSNLKSKDGIGSQGRELWEPVVEKIEKWLDGWKKCFLSLGGRLTLFHVLFKHLQEKLIFTEAKLKESQHQLAPWHSDVIPSNFASTPSHSVGAAVKISNKNGLELVPQPTYSHGNVPISSSDTQTTTDWDLLGRYQSSLGRIVGKNPEPDDLGRYSPLASRNAAAHDAHMQLAVTRGETRTARYGEEATSKQVTFSDPVSSSEMDHPDAEGHQNERDPIVNWSSGNSPYANTFDEPSSSHSPYLPPVLEERSSSFSEAADDDPLPAIEGLQISGEAFIGRELQACGFSINGTTSCNFEWVRHWEDGSFNYIEGAKQPSYLITADDVDAYLAIEVQPLDNRKRKGELVNVFANEHRKITCDSEMQNQIEKTLYSGHASYKLSLSTRYLDIWEPATLAIKREGYSIKSSASSGVVITEKFLPTTTISIPYGHDTEFSIISSGGVEHLLRTDNSSTDVSCSRDTIVLTMRLFIIRASEKRKVKKKGLFVF